MNIFRIFLAIITKKNLKYFQFDDIKNTFIKFQLKKNIFFYIIKKHNNFKRKDFKSVIKPI